MIEQTRSRFGALEAADGAVWLGTPHLAGNDWGLRLGPDALTHWGLRYRRDVPWSEITRLTVGIVESKQRGPVSRIFRGVGLAIDFALSMASGGPPASSTSGIAGPFVRIQCHVTNPADHFHAEGAANWASPLNQTERRAAEQLPKAMLRSERLRATIGDPEAVATLFGRFRAATHPGEIDDAIRAAS